MAPRCTMIAGLAIVLATAGAVPVMAQTTEAPPLPVVEPPPAADVPVVTAWDPLERFNRAMYEFNGAMSTSVVQPVADAYRAAVPQPVRAGIDNVFTNLREPVTAVSSLLQGDWEN